MSVKKWLTDQWRPTEERIDALTLRERGILFIAIMVSLYILAKTFVLDPLSQYQKNLDASVKALANQTTTSEYRLAQLKKSASHGNETEQIRQARLQSELKTVDEQLADFTRGLVSPQEMARLAEKILVENTELKLVRMQSLERENLDQSKTESGAIGTAAAVVTDAAPLAMYRHGLRIVVRGQYVDFVEYLKRLEAMPWKLFWNQVVLESEDDGQTLFTAVVYTVSFESGWIGT